MRVAAVRGAHHALVVGQVFGPLRPPVPREVRRRAEHHQPQLAERLGRQFGIGQLADADGQVQLAFDQVHETVGGREFDLHVRVALHERADQRHHEGRRELHRRGHAQQPPRRVELAAGLDGRRIELRQRSPHAPVVGQPHFGDRRLPRRAAKELHAQAALEHAQRAADGLHRAPQVPSRRALAAVVDDGHEGPDVLNLVHGFSRSG
ncbi:hypothetical protein D3C72_1456590 [compost metagenome]